MKKKIYISLLTFVFFLSTTSLPVSIHFCKMMDTTATESCPMCSSKINTNNGTHNIKSDRASSCCSTQLIDTAVKDNFISNKINFQESEGKFISQVPVEEIHNLLNIYSYTDKDTSPPPVKTNNLYLTNSIFLI